MVRTLDSDVSGNWRVSGWHVSLPLFEALPRGAVIG